MVDFREWDMNRLSQYCTFTCTTSGPRIVKTEVSTGRGHRFLHDAQGLPMQSRLSNRRVAGSENTASLFYLADLALDTELMY